MDGYITIKCGCGSNIATLILYRDEKTKELLPSHAVCHGCMKNICMN